MHAHEHTQQPPKQIVAGLTTKSDKIRALYRRGYSRSEIRRILGIRYQHVRNVLVRDGHLEPRLSGPSRADDAGSAPRSGRPEQVRVVVGPAGRVVIPAAYREVLEIDEGDTVVMRVVGDELHLISDATEVRRVREMIARYVPEGVSLVDELLRERRREVAADGSE